MKLRTLPSAGMLASVHCGHEHHITEVEQAYRQPRLLLLSPHPLAKYKTRGKFEA